MSNSRSAWIGPTSRPKKTATPPRYGTGRRWVLRWPGWSTIPAREREPPDDRRGHERDDQRDDEFHTSTSDDVPSWTSMRLCTANPHFS